MAKFNPDSWPASWILALIASDNVHAFYGSGEWKKLRSQLLNLDKHGRPRVRCYDCERKSPAEVTTATTVHHIKPLRERPDLALSLKDENGEAQLVPLCDSCHWDRHHERKTVRIPERW